MGGQRFDGLIVDFAGVLTTGMVEVVGYFEQPRGLLPAFSQGWAANSASARPECGPMSWREARRRIRFDAETGAIEATVGEFQQLLEQLRRAIASARSDFELAPC